VATDWFGDGVLWDDLSQNGDGTFGVFGVDALNQLTRWPPDWLLQVIGGPLGDLYSFVQTISQLYPDSVVTSWYRSGATQAGLRQAGNVRAATHSSHSWALAFDLSNPDPSSYLIMAELSVEWGSGFYTAPDASGRGAYLDGPHFHVQSFPGRSASWVAWNDAINQAASDVGAVV